MTLLAGIDYSTRQIDAAIIPLDPTARNAPRPQFRTYPLANTNDHVNRLASALKATRQLVGTAFSNGRYGGFYEITSIWVEVPIGRYRTADRALLPIYGVILASASATNVAAAGIPTQEWRRVLGLPPRLTKPEAIHAARTLLGKDAPPSLTEHQAEALLIALAARTLTWQTVA